ncbi:hypothetical protein FOA43_001472 [Brettanomyces nanus]|uniref:Uncharacterized protein n=1 Tax=Eeniella nana TaxID=13502 RepID=A0A875RZJ3_EENNA|nr:uncharacterized protein FOA43_001472 [Brettanomyces nanus]QPG74148.1 hypothetical protein FOA43_001472 [Brettanomyces nanus]
MSSLNPVFSTGRGGAGNMINISTAREAENEIVLSEEQNERQQRSSYKADKEGNYTVSSGRGGAGNITKVKNLPSPKFEPKKSRDEKKEDDDDDTDQLRPVYSIGRGGAGNMVRNTKANNRSPNLQSTTINEDIDNGISPVHSGASDRGLMDTLTENQNSNRGHKLIKKLRKVFGN